MSLRVPDISLYTLSHGFIKRSFAQISVYANLDVYIKKKIGRWYKAVKFR